MPQTLYYLYRANTYMITDLSSIESFSDGGKFFINSLQKIEFTKASQTRLYNEGTNIREKLFSCEGGIKRLQTPPLLMRHKLCQE